MLLSDLPLGVQSAVCASLSSFRDKVSFVRSCRTFSFSVGRLRPDACDLADTTFRSVFSLARMPTSCSVELRESAPDATRTSRVALHSLDSTHFVFEGSRAVESCDGGFGSPDPPLKLLTALEVFSKTRDVTDMPVVEVDLWRSITGSPVGCLPLETLSDFMKAVVAGGRDHLCVDMGQCPATLTFRTIMEHATSKEVLNMEHSHVCGISADFVRQVSEWRACVLTCQSVWRERYRAPPMSSRGMHGAELSECLRRLTTMFVEVHFGISASPGSPHSTMICHRESRWTWMFEQGTSVEVCLTGGFDTMHGMRRMDECVQAMVSLASIQILRQEPLRLCCECLSPSKTLTLCMEEVTLHRVVVRFLRMLRHLEFEVMS
jgi:hypothetical protein